MSLSHTNTLVNQPISTLEEQSQSSHNDRETFNYKDYYCWMNEQLTQRISSLVLLGNPTSRKEAEWRWGKFYSGCFIAS
jgi:hypothetical protein